MLPVLTEDETTEAIEAACKAIEVLEEKLTSQASLAWLEAKLCEELRSGSLESLQVVEWARNGDLIADAALRRVYFEMENLDLKPPAIVKSYCLETIARGPLTRGRGHFWFDNYTRDIGVALLVWLTCEQYGLLPSRNREQRRQERPSGSSIVAAAFRRRENRHLRAERTVYDIWKKHSNQVLTYADRSGLTVSK